MTRSMGDWITGYLEYTENSEPPQLYKEWIAVSTIAAALQRKVSLNYGRIIFYPNFYTVLVGPSGKCRKGTAMDDGKFFLSKLGIRMAAEAITREALIRELKQSNMNPADPLNQANHSSLTIYSQELTVFLGVNNLQLMMDLTDWYDCKSKWTYRTKNMGTDIITGVWVNLIGATTPELISTSLPGNAIGSGLTSRMIFVYEHEISKKVILGPFSERELELQILLENDLSQINTLSGPFKVTEDFYDKWVNWYPTQRAAFKDKNFAGYFERRPTHVQKLSMIMSASRSNDMVITKFDIDRAIDLLERTEVRMPHTFSGIGKSNMAETISYVMNVVGTRKEISFAELMGELVKDVSKEELMSIISTLESMKAVKVNRPDLARPNEFTIQWKGVER